MTTEASLPDVSRRRLIATGTGWVIAALAEAAVYLVLALSIAHDAPPWAVLAMATLSLLVTVLVSRAGYLTGARLAGDLYAQIGQALARAKLSWFTAAHRALITDAAGRGVPMMMGIPAHHLQTFIMAPLVPVATVIAVALVGGAHVAALLAVLLAAALGAQFLAQRLLADADRQRQESEHAVTEATIELVTHRELLRTAAPVSQVLARVERVWSSQEAAMAHTNRVAAPATVVSILASVAPLAGILFYLLGNNGFNDPAAALALLVLAVRAGAPLDDLALAGVAVSDIRANTSAYRAVVSAPGLPTPPDGTAFIPDGHRMELVGVSAPPALGQMSATIPENTRVHVSGPTGAGKSTLLGLLMRFDDPATGTVLLGGVPLPCLGEDEIASRIAYVLQEPVVFTGSLADNIRLGRPGCTEADIVDAAHAAGLEDLLASDPLGIRQEVGPHGSALSGGEQQRVALARAMVKRAPVLILDEATSALDEKTEQRVAEAITSLARTLVVVTHRNPGIWRPDHVIELPSPRVRHHPGD